MQRSADSSVRPKGRSILQDIFASASHNAPPSLPSPTTRILFITKNLSSGTSPAIATKAFRSSVLSLQTTTKSKLNLIRNKTKMNSLHVADKVLIDPAEWATTTGPPITYLKGVSLWLAEH